MMKCYLVKIKLELTKNVNEKHFSIEIFQQQRKIPTKKVADLQFQWNFKRFAFMFVQCP